MSSENEKKEGGGVPSRADEDRQMLFMAYGALKQLSQYHPITLRVEDYLFGEAGTYDPKEAEEARGST